MISVLQIPFVVLGASFVLQSVAAFVGYFFHPKVRSSGDGRTTDLDLTLGASLTLLALIIGFTFSMAVTRYDLRKANEEAEANAIGTEYLRADLLAGDQADELRALLNKYIAFRIQFYSARDESRIEYIQGKTSEIENQLWSVVRRGYSMGQPAIMALVIGGMNDVLNAQGYTEAAWLNRIPVEAFCLMELIATICNVLLGYRLGVRRVAILFVLPAVSSISFYLIADIDSPRSGFVTVVPQNLILQSHSMNASSS